MTDARTEARWDHDRDLRKHDDGALAIDAHTVTLLARAPTTTFDEAVGIIQQFANTAAAVAAVKATQEVGDQMLATFDAKVKEWTNARSG